MVAGAVMKTWCGRVHEPCIRRPIPRARSSVAPGEQAGRMTSSSTTIRRPGGPFRFTLRYLAGRSIRAFGKRRSTVARRCPSVATMRSAPSSPLLTNPAERLKPRLRIARDVQAPHLLCRREILGQSRSNAARRLGRDPPAFRHSVKLPALRQASTFTSPRGRPTHIKIYPSALSLASSPSSVSIWTSPSSNFVTQVPQRP